MQKPTVVTMSRYKSLALTPWFIADQDSFFAFLRSQASIVKFKLPTQACLVANDPEVIKQILIGEESKHYDVADLGMDVLGQLIGHTGVLTIPKGERHDLARKHLGRALLGKGLERANHIMWEEATSIVSDLDRLARAKLPFDMAPIMGLYAIRVIARAVFGMNLSQDMIKTTRDAVEEGLDMVFPKMRMPFGWPLKWRPRFRHHLNALDEIVEHMIITRKKAGDWKEGEDTLSILLQLYHDGEIDLQEVRDNLKTMFIAGHETTASALTWLWHMLSDHTDLYDWIQDEASTQHGPIPAKSRGHFKRIEALINESMRLHPVASIFARIATTRHTLLGETIEPRTLVFFSNLARHRDPTIWGGDADRVRPTRFLEDLSPARLKLIHTPFGGGNRTCLGLAFAMSEMLTLITLVSQRNLRFRAAPGTQPKIKSAMTRHLPHFHVIAYHA